MSMTHHGMSGHPTDEYYGCELCTEPKIKSLEARNIDLENKYEGYLQSLRDNWKADADERQAFIEKLESENKRLREALDFIMQTLKNDAIEGYDQKADKIYKSALEDKK